MSSLAGQGLEQAILDAMVRVREFESRGVLTLFMRKRMFDALAQEMQVADGPCLILGGSAVPVVFDECILEEKIDNLGATGYQGAIEVRCVEEEGG